jgi:glyoxylase-like metal-dependent hydrolase (beta-lactamase superfamily II)
MSENCYLLVDPVTNQLLVVDPGDVAEYIIDHIERIHATPIAVIATHGHFDHIMGAFAITKTYLIPFCMDGRDTFLLDTMQSSAQHFLGTVSDPPPHIDTPLTIKKEVALGNERLRILETLGHTPGSISLYSKTSGVVFVGDLVFEGGDVGRTDFSYSDGSKLYASVKKLITLPDNTIVYPGHGNSFLLSSVKSHFL